MTSGKFPKFGRGELAKSTRWTRASGAPPFKQLKTFPKGIQPDRVQLDDHLEFPGFFLRVPGFSHGSRVTIKVRECDFEAQRSALQSSAGRAGISVSDPALTPPTDCGGMRARSPPSSRCDSMQEKDGMLAAPGHPSPESSTLSAHTSVSNCGCASSASRAIAALAEETREDILSATPALASAGIRLLVPSPITLLGVDSGDRADDEQATRRAHPLTTAAGLTRRHSRHRHRRAGPFDRELRVEVVLARRWRPSPTQMYAGTAPDSDSIVRGMKAVTSATGFAANFHIVSTR
ncbi:hypothetical protein GGG16DRAFT_119730 [Schizophyllum commune]